MLAVSCALWSSLRLLCCKPLAPFLSFDDSASTEIYTLSLHDALPICIGQGAGHRERPANRHRLRRLPERAGHRRSEEHTSELQSLRHLVCRLLLEKKKSGVRWKS